MHILLQNENYGYSVATKNKWVAVGNPSFNQFPAITASLSTSGSVDVWLYSKKIDAHILKDTFYRHLWPEEEILLASESATPYSPSTAESILHTEPFGTVPTTEDLDIAVDWGDYFTSSHNDYGICVDIHQNYLGVGYTHHSMSFYFSSASLMIHLSGSGAVDIYNLSTLDPDPISKKDPLPEPTQLSPPSPGKYTYWVNVPKGYSAISFQTSNNLSDWTTLQTIHVDYENGGTYMFEFPTWYIKLYVRVVENTLADPYVLSIKNPHPQITNSFGRSVSINDNWIAIGSPEYSESKGAVYMYKRYGRPTNNNMSWSFHSIITASDSKIGDYFGWSLELNDDSGSIGYSTKNISYPESLIVGSNRASGSKVYYYEISGSWSVLIGTVTFDNSVWKESNIFDPIYTNYPFTHYPLAYPILSGSYTGPAPVADKFGYDVSIYGGTVAIGAPYDRYYYEYESSSVYHQGAFYIFERCVPPENGWHLKLKSHGDEKVMKSHLLGYCLDTHDKRLVVGCPKITSISPCYVQGSLYQAHFCRTEDEYQIQGQYCYLQYNTSSTEWEYKNTYQIRKNHLSPYRNFGYSIDMSDRFIVVGSPVFLSGSWRTVDVFYSGSNPEEIEPVAGQAYIYNLSNYRNEFNVGNVFYRNGKIVIITSGSSFDGLFFNNISDQYYQYDLKFHNKQTIHEKQIICSVEPGEFNVSTNPTALQYYSSSSFDINKNGKFDFQDLNILMMYMNWKRTEDSSNQTTNWSQSILSSDDEISWFNYLNSCVEFYGTEGIYSSSFSSLNTTNMYNDLDLNKDNVLDINDQNILWKYFSKRLDQKNFDKYITVNSSRKLYSDLIDYLNSKTNRNCIPYIKSDFFDYDRLSKNDQTGSYLTPYVTSVGLYAGGDLAAVAKFGSPIKLLPDYPYNFIVKMDF